MDEQEKLSGSIEEVQREIRMRRAFYPEWIERGKLEQSKADERLERLEWALDLLLVTKSESTRTHKNHPDTV